MYERFISHLRNKNSAATTIDDYERTYRRFFSRFTSLDSVSVAKFIGRRGLRDSTREKYRLQLKGLADYLDVAIDWDREVPQRKVPIEAPIVFTDEHADLTYQYILAYDKMYAAMFMLLLHTGLRVSEAIGLRQHDVHEKFLTIRKAGNRTHSKDGRVVPLDSVAADILSYYGVPLRFRPHTLSDLIARAREEYDLPHYTTHSIRKTWATRALLREKRDIFSLCRAGGWSDPKVLYHYISGTPEAVCQAFV